VRAACDGASTTEAAPPGRGLVTTQVSATEESTIRRYPGVIEPSEITALSFEVAGKLGEIALSVGQRVTKGDLLAQLDAKDFEVAIENRQAAVDEARAVLEQERVDLGRQQTLRNRGVTTVAALDQARTDFRRAQAQFTQAEKNLEAANEDLADTTLSAPFDGIINSVDADSFATVAAGTAVTSLYSAVAYEVSFSVNFDVVSRLVVGTPAAVRLADDPDTVLAAVVKELGERADTVSSFPVVVALTQDSPLIRAGMAVEASFEFALDAPVGFLIPVSAAIIEGEAPPEAATNAPIPIEMYVFDESAGVVRRRAVLMGGIRENKFLIIDGLSPGEHVATAGVSFLRDGMKVKLIAPGG